MNNASLRCPIFSLNSLLDCSKFSESRGNEAKDDPRKDVPESNWDGSDPSDEFREFSGEEDDVESGFREVRVDDRKGVGPFLDIRGKPLVRVIDSAI